MIQRNNKGQFIPGNKEAKKIKKCPHCNKTIDVILYAYLKPPHPTKNGSEAITNEGCNENV